MPKIGFFNSRETCAIAFFEHLLETLKPKGYVEGKSLAIDRQCAVFDERSAQSAAAALESAGVQLIYAFGEKDVKLIRKGAQHTPIIALVDDAIEDGLTKSYSRPEGNVTGLCNADPHQPEKIFELLRRIAPEMRRIAFVQEGAHGAPVRSWLGKFERGASKSGFIVTTRVAPLAQFPKVYSELEKAGIRGAFVWTQKWDGNEALYRLAAEHRIAAVSLNPDFAKMGGLMGYSVWHRRGTARLTEMVDKVLRGAKPADLPWELPDTPLLSLNLKVAKALNLTIPNELLLLATDTVD